MIIIDDRPWELLSKEEQESRINAVPLEKAEKIIKEFKEWLKKKKSSETKSDKKP